MLDDREGSTGKILWPGCFIEDFYHVYHDGSQEMTKP